MAFDERVALCIRFEVIDRFDERNARFFRQLIGDESAEVRMRVNAGADRRSADRQFGHAAQSLIGSLHGKFQLPSEAADFLSESQGGGVGEVSATDLDHAVPVARLLRQFIGAAPEGREEAVLDFDRDRDMDRGGENVVGALAQVDVVVFVNRIGGRRAVAAE